MARICGVDIPDKKRIDIALTYIYGIGRVKAVEILKKTNIDRAKRTLQLSGEEIASLQKAIDTYPTEGELRRMVQENIKRLKVINSYRGYRHSVKLPGRGQRTRSNARTRRGKKMTVGALRKEMRQKLDAAKKDKGTEEKK